MIAQSGVTVIGVLVAGSESAIVFLLIAALLCIPIYYRMYKKDYEFFTYQINTVLCEEGRSISKKRLERKLGSIDLKDLLEILKIKEYIFIEKNT